MRRDWDVVVIGAGPAGLTAAHAAASEGLSCACIDRLGPGGTLMNLSRIHDHPGEGPATTSEQTGADIVAGLLDEAMGAAVEMVFGEVQAVSRQSSGNGWLVRTDEEEHGARAVILATGLSAGSLGVPDEESYAGRGLSHCAACDGPMFAGQNVVVTGNDPWTWQEALELAEVAGHVTVVSDQPLVKSTDATHEKIALVPGRVTALEGGNGLEQVAVATGGGEQRILAEGLFAYQDRRPQIGFLAEPPALDEAGRVLVDSSALTRVPFLFAVGDVRAGSLESVAGAIADGKRAGLAAAGLLKA